MLGRNLKVQNRNIKIHKISKVEKASPFRGNTKITNVIIIKKERRNGANRIIEYESEKFYHIATERN